MTSSAFGGDCTAFALARATALARASAATVAALAGGPAGLAKAGGPRARVPTEPGGGGRSEPQRTPQRQIKLGRICRESKLGRDRHLAEVKDGPWG